MTQSARQQLVNLRRQREAVAREQAMLGPKTRMVLQTAAAEGVSKTEIARLAGVSRQTVYDILGSDA